MLSADVIPVKKRPRFYAHAMGFSALVPGLDAVEQVLLGVFPAAAVMVAQYEEPPIFTHGKDSRGTAT
jgi:hypothetical protein